MNSSPEAGEPHRCPDRNTLIAFNTGRLGERDMERLAGHLETCARCITTLRDLASDPADTFEARLLKICQEPSSGTATVDPACAGLEAAARALCFADTAEPGAPGADTTRFEVGNLGAIGPYTVTDILGRGGMGIVYRAVHGVLKWTVALKTLHPGIETRPDAVARFQFEGEAFARLDHPNIVKVRDFGESEGRPYLATEVVEGETLSRRLGRGPLGLRKAAELVRTLAAAVGYAHGEKILHRDLKPSNVLIARDGTPKITDFGLAKVLGETRGLTQTDAVMGTPSYMAPEQADGRPADVDQRTDVYALGAILYECLVGAPPFAGESKLRIIDRVRKGGVVPPSRHRDEIPTDLEEICLKCLELLPGDRYRSANELARALDDWLEDRPVHTRRPSRLRRLFRRVRAPRVLAGVAVVASTAGLLAAFPPWNRPAVGTPAVAVPEHAPQEVRKPNGELLPFRVWHGNDQTRVTADADGTVTVNTWGLCLVEFVHPPAGEAYTFRADIRHAASHPAGLVGLYFAHREFPGTHGKTHQYGQVTYNDLFTPAEHLAVAGAELPLPIPPRGEGLPLLTFLVKVDRPGRPWTGTTQMAAGELFKVCGFRADCWRHMEVALAPDGVRAAWEGRPVRRRETEEVPAGAISRALKGRLTTARGLFPGDELLAAVPDEYTPHGRVGLLVERSSASFRGVSVTPIKKKD